MSELTADAREAIRAARDARRRREVGLDRRTSASVFGADQTLSLVCLDAADGDPLRALLYAVDFTRARKRLEAEGAYSPRVNLIDLDDYATWPPGVVEWVGNWAAHLRDSTEYTVDLAIPLEREADFGRLVERHRLLAYHCTRLLDHETEDVRTNGLRPLTSELVDGRIDQAELEGAISSRERDIFRDLHVFASQEPEFARQRPYREGQTCLILGRSAFEHDVGGVEWLLSTWGGEALYMAGAEHRPRLRELGRPAIVVASLAPAAIIRTGPSLSRLFVGASLGLDDVFADVFYREPLSGSRIIDIWQPGHPEYDRHPRLPMG